MDAREQKGMEIAATVNLRKICLDGALAIREGHLHRRSGRRSSHLLLP